MDKEQELRERMEIIAAWRKDDAWDLCSEVFLDPLTDLLCSDEALARKFFTECTDEEFDLAYRSFERLAQVYGKSFIRWLAINASHRDLDIDGDSWYEMHAAMAEVDLIPADGQLYHHSDEEVKRMVVEAARKLEAEGNKS